MYIFSRSVKIQDKDIKWNCNLEIDKLYIFDMKTWLDTHEYNSPTDASTMWKPENQGSRLLLNKSDKKSLSQAAID